MGSGALRPVRALWAQERPAASGSGHTPVEAFGNEPTSSEEEAFTNETAMLEEQAMAAHASGASSSSSSGAPAAAGGAADAAVAGVVWASLDPRKGELQVYPREVACRLEAAHRRTCAGRRRAVALQGLGGIYEDACVEMGGDEAPVQRTSKGRRDVRRLEVPQNASGVQVSVIPSRTWRIAEIAVPGVTEDRFAPVSPAQLVSVEEHDPDPAASARQRKAAVQQQEADGLVALWEWCRAHGPKDPADLPPEAWGIYGEEHEEAIETAFREGKPTVAICIGIRTYDLIFSGIDGGKQVDRALNKRRLVRRRTMRPEERDAVLRAASEAFAADNADVVEGECAVCFADFAETPAIPVVRLAECGHCFHGACVQEIADRNDPCPLCRSVVDWRAALRALADPRKGGM